MVLGRCWAGVGPVLGCCRAQGRRKQRDGDLPEIYRFTICLIQFLTTETYILPIAHCNTLQHTATHSLFPTATVSSQPAQRQPNNIPKAAQRQPKGIFAFLASTLGHIVLLTGCTRDQGRVCWYLMNPSRRSSDTLQAALHPVMAW